MHEIRSPIFQFFILAGHEFFHSFQRDRSWKRGKMNDVEADLGG